MDTHPQAYCNSTYLTITLLLQSHDRNLLLASNYVYSPNRGELSVMAKSGILFQI